jgi:hypothetical protein
MASASPSGLGAITIVNSSSGYIRPSLTSCLTWSSVACSHSGVFDSFRRVKLTAGRPSFTVLPIMLPVPSQTPASSMSPLWQQRPFKSILPPSCTACKRFVAARFVGEIWASFPCSCAARLFQLDCQDRCSAVHAIQLTRRRKQDQSIKLLVFELLICTCIPCTQGRTMVL